MKIWITKIWKPSISQFRNLVILLDDSVCYKSSDFKQLLADIRKNLELIPGGYICKLQPCNVGITFSFKYETKKQHMIWASSNS